MNYGVVELKEKIDFYFEGHLSKEELGSWTEHAYYDLLKGGYIEKAKIAVYPFLKTVSKIKVEDNDIKDEYPCSEEEVKEIQAILHGKKDFDFEVELTVPNQIKSTQICDSIELFRKGELQDGETLRKLMMHLEEKQQKNETIVEELEDCIIQLCRALFEMDLQAVERKPRLRLYPGKEDGNYASRKLIDYLECYIGVKSFCVLVSYRDGAPKVRLLV